MPLFENTEKEIVIPGPEGGLQARIQGPVTPESGRFEDAFGLVCHPHSLMGGTMNNKVVHTIARVMRDIGMRNVRFNFRGVEKSDGSYAEGIGEVEDLLAVVAWCEEQRPGARFYIAGFSFGSYVAASATRRLLEQGVNVEKLLLIAPPVERMNFFDLLPLGLSTLVVQGEEDEVVRATEVYAWCERDQQHILLKKIPGASHFFHGKLTELKNQATDFLSRSG